MEILQLKKIQSSSHEPHEPTMVEATLRLMSLPHNSETDQVIGLTKRAITQLDAANPMSSLHRSASRIETASPQASNPEAEAGNYLDNKTRLTPLSK